MLRVNIRPLDCGNVMCQGGAIEVDGNTIRQPPYVHLGIQLNSKMRKRTRDWATYKEPLAKRTFAYNPQAKGRKLVRPTPVPFNIHERKVNDIAAATYQVNTGGSFTLLCNPQLGSDMNNRIGRKILIKSAYIRGFLSTEPAGSAAVNSVGVQQARFILFCDMQPNANAPAVTDLLVAATPISHLNLNNRDRFRVYADKMFTFGPYFRDTTATQSVAAAAQQAYTFKKFKRLNLETVFNATNGGSIADINSGALYMFWIGSVGAGTTDVNAILTTRVRYVDN